MWPTAHAVTGFTLHSGWIATNYLQLSLMIVKNRRSKPEHVQIDRVVHFVQQIPSCSKSHLESKWGRFMRRMVLLSVAFQLSILLSVIESPFHSRLDFVYRLCTNKLASTCLLTIKYSAYEVSSSLSNPDKPHSLSSFHPLQMQAAIQSRSCILQLQVLL